MAALVVIEDGTILSMLANKTLANSIPCFTGRKNIFGGAGGGCGACARKRQQKQREELTKIKMCLAALSPEKKAELKTHVGAEQLRIVYVNNAGQTVQMTF
jgi:hypothetical protein